MKKSLYVSLMICFFLTGSMKSSAQINWDNINLKDIIGKVMHVKKGDKAASYKAVDIFNGIAVKKIKDIFSIRPASNNYGLGLFVKL